MKIRLIEPSDLSMLVRHRIRHSNENGRDGDIIFMPSEEPYQHKEENLKRDAEALLKTVTTPGWSRIFVVTDETEIFGDLTLVSHHAMKATLHRCLLMMGLERSIRAKGWGSKLMTEAIDWTRKQPTLEWITLNVFENNPPAKALYKKFGFQTVGTTRDLFRVFDQSIDDTAMVLKLR